MELFGREGELAPLRRELDRAVAGEGRTVFVRGAPGVGKTGLASAIVAEARERGITPLTGRAWPLDADLAYASLVHAIGPGLRGMAARARQSAVAGLPDLARLFTDLDLAPAPELGDAALEKTRLFESVSRLLERMTAAAPLLLFIDDLHYADGATLELLHYLSRRLCDAPAILLFTLRPGVWGPTLDRLVRQGQLGGTAVTVDVEPLGSTALRALAESALGGRASDDLVELLEQRTGGAPFFAHALLAALRRDDGLVRAGGRWKPRRAAKSAVPPEVHELVTELVDGLAAPARIVLQHLAVGGSAVPLATLRAVAGLPDGELQVALGQLQAAGTVVEAAGDASEPAFAIRHPLTQEAVHGMLSAPQRTAAHRRFLEVTPGDGPELARHVRCSGGDQADPDRALRILLQAATLARRRYAADETARWLSAARALARRYALPVRLRDILEPLGEALSAVGELSAAAEVWTEALALPECTPADSAELRHRLARLLWELGRPEDATVLVAAGIEALQPAGPSDAWARLVELAIRLADRRGDDEEVMRLCKSLMRGDAASKFLYALAELHLQCARGRLLDALRAADRARELASTVAERIHCEAYGIGMTLLTGTASDDDIAAYRRLAEEARVPALTHPLGLLVGWQLLHRGDLPAARSHLEEALTEPSTTPRMMPILHAYCSITHALQGNLNEAETELGRAVQLVGPYRDDIHITEHCGTAQAILAIERDDGEAAREAADAIRCGMLEVWPACARAHAWLVAGDADRAHEAARALTERFADVDFGRGCSGYVLGLAAAARGDAAAASEALKDAIAGFDRTGTPLFVARARLALAALPTTPKSAARTAARQALADFDRCSARRYQDRARALLRGLGDRVPARRAATGEATLSSRELEVARLAAAGQTNAQIGRTLFISPHTAATHMRNILRRTGVHNRPALATWLRDHGLLEG